MQRIRKVLCASAALSFVMSAAVVTAGLSSASAASSAVKWDTGVGTAAALANPKCDPATKRMKYPTITAPLCVKAWKAGADNGGATAQGVTATSIKVVVLVDTLPDAQFNTKGLYTNQALGVNERDGAKNATIDWNAVLANVYETYGRKVEFTFVKPTGTDETAQRADAVSVAAMKPFAVYDAASQIGTPAIGGGYVFDEALRGAGVPVVLPASVTTDQASRGYSQVAAEFIGKQLKGGKAEYAGDALKTQPRKFGVLYASNVDIAYFKSEMKKYGVPLTAEASFTVPPGAVATTATPDIDAQLPPLLAKLKDSGVNNLILFANQGAAAAASKAMKAQEWFPEITVTSYPYTDLDILTRAWDQDVWSHAFGLAWFPPGLAVGTPYPSTYVQGFQWYWGTDKGTKWDGAGGSLPVLYADIQFAGPNLTKKNVDAVPDLLAKQGGNAGGAYSNSAFTFEVPVVKSGDFTPRGVAMVWWNPKLDGPGNYNLSSNGTGQYMYLDGGKRYTAGTFPTAKKKFFDAASATGTFPAVPASEPKAPTYPCTGCPSSGSATPAPASST